MNTAIVVLCCWMLAPALAYTLRAAPHADQPQPEASHTFQGSWSAVGRRDTLPTESGRTAAIVALSGAVTLTEPSGTRAGFQGQAIAFDDGGSLSTGRAIWIDSRGDRIFSTLRGESLQSGRRIAGTITGGTGRYAGLTGEYALTWQYVVDAADDDVVQGRTVDLTGRFRSGERRP
jgi:hypothetical protein